MFLHNQGFQKSKSTKERYLEEEKMSNIRIPFLWSFIVLWLCGCSAMPVSQSLGMERNEKGWNKDNGYERLVTAFILQELPDPGLAIGYEITLPEELKKTSMVGVEKEFTTMSGQQIRLTRKAFQGVLPDGRHVSVYVSDGRGFVFDVRAISSITLYDPMGRSYIIRELRQLEVSERESLYEKMESDFPELTYPIEGIRFHFGPETDWALQVPPTVTLGERASVAGLLAVRLTPNVWGEVISKGFAAYRTVSLSPVKNSLAGKSEVSDQQTHRSQLLVGDR